MTHTPDSIHKTAIVIDGHNDSMVRRLSRGDPMDLAVADERYHTDLPRLRHGGVTALFSYCGSTDLAKALQLLDAIHRMLADHPESFALVRNAEDIRSAKNHGAVGIIPQLESLSCCGGNVGALRALHRLGVRVGNLTHGEAPEHGCQREASLFDYCTPQDRERMRTDAEGLTDFGRAAIKDMNELGMVVDLAHANDATFFETLELTDKPPVFSHGGVFALCPHSRGLTDDQIRALAETGGVHGLACFTKFIHQTRPDMKALVNQIEYSINLVGPDHVGIGADYDGLPDEEIPVPPHIGRLGDITAEMASRGWDQETMKKVLGGNFLRAIEQVMM